MFSTTALSSSIKLSSLSSRSGRSALLSGPDVGLPGAPRLPRGAVAPLVVFDGRQDALQGVGPPLPIQPLLAHHIHRTAHLLQRHLRIFFPEADPSDRPRSPSPPGTGSCDA